MKRLPQCPLCGHDAFERVFVYDAPPPGENRFPFSDGAYYREVLRCEVCDHFVSVHEMDLSALYQAAYVDSVYRGDTLRHTYERIIRLGPDRSDNAGRVRHVAAFADRCLTRPARENRPPRVLDVGSGLGVFPYGIKQLGWVCTALDPDPRAVEHARNVVGVEAVCTDFLVAESLGTYDLVTFNKVLEHVEDPVGMLACTAAFLHRDGFVYVELPDGETAAREGAGREEFFVEHHHIFSAASLALLAQRAGFSIRQLERVQEPSTKYTLRAFLAPAT